MFTADAFQWLAGGYYSYLKSTWDQTAVSPPAANEVYGTGLYLPVTAADNPLGIIYRGHVPYESNKTPTDMREALDSEATTQAAWKDLTPPLLLVRLSTPPT